MVIAVVQRFVTTHVLQPAATVTLALPGDDSQYFMQGYNACNFVGYSGSVDGDHTAITEAMTTAAACPYDGLGWYEQRVVKR